MKVLFKNAKVDVWKLRKGVVVDTEYGFGHIVDIGTVNKIDDEIIMSIRVNSHEQYNHFDSDCVTWMEP